MKSIKIMKEYTLNTKFNFGKHKSETLKQVVDFDFNYIEWCLIYHKEFLISDEVLNEIKDSNSEITISEIAEFARQLKMKNEYPIDFNNNNIWASIVIRKAFVNVDF
jgi:hypothetical protein